MCASGATASRELGGDEGGGLLVPWLEQTGVRDLRESAVFRNELSKARRRPGRAFRGWTPRLLPTRPRRPARQPGDEGDHRHAGRASPPSTRLMTCLASAPSESFVAVLQQPFRGHAVPQRRTAPSMLPTYGCAGSSDGTASCCQAGATSRTPVTTRVFAHAWTTRARVPPLRSSDARASAVCRASPGPSSRGSCRPCLGSAAPCRCCGSAGRSRRPSSPW